MQKKLGNAIGFLKIVPSFLTVAFTAYALAANRMAALSEKQLLGWLLALVGLLATSELIERLGRFRKIEAASLETLEAIRAMSLPDAESILRDRGSLLDLSTEASRAREIWACGYSLVNLIDGCEGYLTARLREGCNLRFLLLDPQSDEALKLDRLITSMPGELVNDIGKSLSRLERIRAQATTGSARTGRLDIRLLKVAPTCSLVIVDPSRHDGSIRVELYPSCPGGPIDVGRPHLVLTRPQGKWYRFFCQQFEGLWKSAAHAESHSRESDASPAPRV